MRSAVSAILLGSAPDQNMSYPDYQQLPHDHQSLLVVVRHIGSQLRTKQFNKVFDRISRTPSLKVIDLQNNSRTVWIRFLRSYPVENNDWGDFQTHRRALGLISIGQCSSQEELNELCRIHESLKVKYAWTLYDSRCMIFGLNTDGSIHDETHSSEGSPTVEVPNTSQNEQSKMSAKSPNTSKDSMTSSEDAHDERQGSPAGYYSDSASEDSSSRSESVTGTTHGNLEGKKESLSPTDISKPLVPPSNFNARTLYYPTMDRSQSLELDIEEFVKALFWVLESKRVDKIGLRKADRSLLLSSLCAPFEKKDFIGLDLESKNNKKRADGRLKKQLGDLNLQAGIPQEAIVNYIAAAEILKSVNDWLWLAGALEGMCSASVIILYPHLRRNYGGGIQRNSSLQGIDYVKMKQTDLNKSKTQSKALGETMDGKIIVPKNCLSADDILEKYREAVTHYGKYRQAGVIEVETSIKAAIVLIEQKETLHAADFLQNAVFISLQLSEEEKMQRYCALSSLYEKLGLYRKGAFFKRVAAMRCVSPSNPQPNWSLCHSLLFQLIGGYNLSLDPNEKEKFGFYGWPRLQIQVLQELVGTAKKKGNVSLATRYMSLLLHSMLPHLSLAERGEFSIQLESFSSETEGTLSPLVLENGLIVPPIHLTHIPLAKVFKLIPPTPHLKPERDEVKSACSLVSPFVYTPINIKREKAKDSSIAEFCWVEGELCSVNIILENPLPIELKLNSISLITEGVNFHVNSNVVSIPAESSMFPANLSGTPLAPGNLRILGYSTYTLGVKSNIKLKNIRGMKSPYIDVEIVPALPFLEIKTSKPKSEFFSSFSDSIVTSASISLMMGENQEFSISFTNVGKVPVDTLTLLLDSSIDKRVEDILTWDDAEINRQLPLPPGNVLTLKLFLYGAGDFISSGDFYNESASSSASSQINTHSSDGPSSMPSRLNTTISELLRSSSSSKSNEMSNNSSSSRAISLGSIGSNAAQTTKHSVSFLTKTYEAVLKVKYSGGPGKDNGVFRTCGIAINVEVSPAMLITKWDILPGESMSKFYLVLDVWNTTQHEMELKYGDSKEMLVEKCETCRIPIVLEKYPLSTIQKGKEEAVCCEHIVNSVNLEWVLPECSGKATLEGISLTPSMIQLISVSHIEWEMSINGEIVKAKELPFEAGDMINIIVSLKNHLEEDLKDVRLSLEFYQDYQYGKCNYHLDSRLAVIGNDCVVIPKISPKDSFKHSLSLIFYVPGLYKIDFKCEPKDVKNAAYSNMPISGILHDYVWKYNHPLDFNIS